MTRRMAAMLLVNRAGPDTLAVIPRCLAAQPRLDFSRTGRTSA